MSWAYLLLRIFSVLVPGDRREEWLEEWDAELAALAHEADGPGRYPGALSFVAGALPHAFWMRREGWTLDAVFLDLRYAGRVLLRSPGFTFVAALTLALGFGANGALFSMVNGLVLRSPDQISQPDRLVQIGRSELTEPGWNPFSWPNTRIISQEAPGLAGVAGFSDHYFVVGEEGSRQGHFGQFVTGSYFDLLGVRPAHGRLIQPADDMTIGGHPVVVLSHRLWLERFGGDPELVGTTVSVDGARYEVLGVAPRGFVGVRNVGFRPDLFVPATMNPGYNGDLPFSSWRWKWLNLLGRLEEGRSASEVEAALPGLADRLRSAHPDNAELDIVLERGVGLDPLGRAETERLAMILWAVAGLVLLLTCTTVANLFLARTAARRSEMGVRLALGAGRGRVLRQIMTETGVLAALAVLLSLPLVIVGADLLPSALPLEFTRSPSPDSTVLLALGLGGLAVGCLFGALPAWSVSRRRPGVAIRSGAATSGSARSRLQDILVVGQLALSLGLVTGASLLARSALNVRGAEPGFEPRGVSAGYVNLAATGRYDEASGAILLEELLRELEAQPGVRSATLATQLPIAGGQSMGGIWADGRQEDGFEVETAGVGPRYFETLGIPVVRGRGFAGVRGEPDPVVILSESAADRLWPEQDPLGRFVLGGYRVVGIVPDIQMRSLREPGNPAIYFPLSQLYQNRIAVVVATAPGASPEEALQAAVARVDPELPAPGALNLFDEMVASMSEIRTLGALVGVFALLSLVLATVGLYGLVAYGASRRVREFGIRVALGARPGSLSRLILARGLRIAVVGVGAGAFVAYGLGRAFRTVLFGVGALDISMFLVATTILLSASALAAWLPARRAARLDAAVTLRE